MDGGGIEKNSKTKLKIRTKKTTRQRSDCVYICMYELVNEKKISQQRLIQNCCEKKGAGEGK